ncbi:MAG: hypothetical protein QME51_11180, partial [Planctomycetota bacterium]|nr:hypothetical protein [Planctomycetota bacterium]
SENIRELYAQAKELLPQKGKDIVTLSDDITEYARKTLKIESAKLPSQQDKNIMTVLQDILPDEKMAGYTTEQIEKIPALKAALRQPRSISWEGLDSTRGALLEKVRGITRAQGMPTNESRIYSELAEKIDDELLGYAGEIGGEAKTALDTARAASRQMHELYNKDILKIMNKSPEDILKKVVNQGEITLFRQIKGAVGEVGLEPIRKGFFKHIIDSSSTGGVFNPGKMQKMLTSLGDDTLKELATPAQADMLKNIAKKGLAINEKMAGQDFLETIAGTSNEAAANAIFKNVSNIKTAQRLLSPKRIKELTATILENRIFKTSGGGYHLPLSSANAFKTHRNELKALLPPKQFSAVEDFIKLGQKMDRVESLAKNASQTGQVFVGHNALQLLFNVPLKAAKMTIIPWLMAHAYVSPLALRYMTSAAKLPVNSPKAIDLFIKGWGILARDQGNLGILPPDIETYKEFTDKEFTETDQDPFGIRRARP